jgi:hypothetical protein
LETTVAGIASILSGVAMYIKDPLTINEAID